MQSSLSRARRNAMSCGQAGWLLVLLISVLCVAGGCTEQKPAAEAPRAALPKQNCRIVVLQPDDGDLTEQLQAEVKKAKEAGRQPFIEVYADWCPPCKAIQHYIDDPLMVAAFDGVHLIKLSVDQWDLSDTPFAVDGIPTFIELDHKAEPTGRAISSSVWGEDIPVNMAPPLKAFFHGQ